MERRVGVRQACTRRLVVGLVAVAWCQQAAAKAVTELVVVAGAGSAFQQRLNSPPCLLVLTRARARAP